MGAEDAILSLGAQPITLTRYSAETIVNGQRVRGTPSTLTIQGVIQPITSDEVQYLPEGVEAQLSFKLYSQSLVRTADDIGRTEADKILYNSRTYEVKTVENWQGYYKALITEVHR